MKTAEEKKRLTERLRALVDYGKETSTEFAEVLMEGADPNAIGTDGWSVVHLVKHVQVLELLKEEGADLEQRTTQHSNGVPSGSTPLMKNAIFGYEEACRTLIGMGADISARNALGNGLAQVKAERVREILIGAGILKHLTKEELKGFSIGLPKAKKELLLRAVQSLQKKGAGGMEI
jgi:hypothetical protein